MIADVRGWLRAALESRVSPGALAWYEGACAEVAKGCTDLRFATLISMASRHARRHPMQISEGEFENARQLVEGWNPERWSLLDLLRVGLVLSRSDLEEASAAPAVCGMAKFADVGELCALYRSMAFLPRPADYVWQAGEGCRSNMNEVFESIACDHPFPAAHFDEIAWRALVVKAVFVNAPLWRVHGIDERHSEELAVVALDLADERRSAGRDVQPQLWMALGTHGGDRALESLTREMSAESEAGRRGAAIALVRAGAGEHLEGLRASETSSAVLETIDRALAGHSSQFEYRSLHSDH